MIKAVIISISSDIGIALANKWIEQKWDVYGTFRSRLFNSSIIKNIQNEKLVYCDLLIEKSVDEASDQLIKRVGKWDVLIIASGDLEPIGDFKNVNFDDWADGLKVNLTNQLRILHNLLPYRNIETKLTEPSVLFFAGGGTNNAVKHYSSYTLSKIALIKMCELLDAEILDTRFLIVGPGVVKTKIHEPTLRLGSKAAGDNYKRTLNRLKNNECTPMNEVVDCCDWLVKTSHKEVRGRNFSVASDKWNTQILIDQLKKDNSMYKLRRHNNDWVTK